MTADKSSDATPLLYARGFLLAPQRVVTPVSGWLESEVGDRWLYRDPRLSLSWGSSGGCKVHILGRGTLLGAGGDQASPLAQHLAEMLMISRDALDDELEVVCGNYAMIISDGVRPSIQSDAGGLRSIFYSPDTGMVGSHARLVAAMSSSNGFNEFNDPSWETANSVSYLPGVRTVFDGVLQLTPNTELDLEAMLPRRVFPRRPPLALEVPEILERVEPLLSSQMSYLTSIGKELMISLTAGIDSRTSLALLRPVADRLTAFTYVLGFGRYRGMKTMEIDEEVAGDIAHTLSIEHRVARIDDPEVRPTVREAALANSHHEHIWPLAQWYLDNLSPDTLHVRSNLYEIGRAFYRKGFTRDLPLSPYRMAETHRKSYGQREPAVSAFQEFVRLTDFDALMGHDPYDFFYWEHRVGRWHATVVAESDMSHETWVLINSRKVLELLLAAPLPKRVEAVIYRRLISGNWPELDRWPVNDYRK